MFDLSSLVDDRRPAGPEGHRRWRSRWAATTLGTFPVNNAHPATPTSSTSTARRRSTSSSRRGRRLGGHAAGDGATTGTRRPGADHGDRRRPRPDADPDAGRHDRHGIGCRVRLRHGRVARHHGEPGHGLGHGHGHRGAATTLGTATITNGAGTLALAAKSLKPGTHILTLGYAGNATHLARPTPSRCWSTKAGPKVTASGDPVDRQGRRGTAPSRGQSQVSAARGLRRSPATVKASYQRRRSSRPRPRSLTVGPCRHRRKLTRPARSAPASRTPGTRRRATPVARRPRRR